MSEARSGGLSIVSGSTYPEFAERVAAQIPTQTMGVERRKFSNGELFTRYEESLRGNDVFVFQSHDGQSTEHRDWSINDAIQEHVLMIDAAAGASADHVTAVCTHFGYARQDKKDDGRVPIAARRVARQLVDAGAEVIISMDLHSAQIQGFTDNESFENLYASPVLLESVQTWVADKDKAEITVVAPDVGRVKLAAYYAHKLGAKLAIINKERSSDSSRVRTTDIIGEVASKHCVIVDDMIDTAKTLGASAHFLQREGAISVIATATHAILSGPAVDHLNDSPIERIIVTDTIPQHDKQRLMPQLEVVSVTPIFAEAVRRIHHGQSVSALFESQQIVF